VIVKFGFDEAAENWEFHRAPWHKSCYAKFSSCKFERAKLKRNRAVIRQKQAFAVSDSG